MGFVLDFPNDSLNALTTVLTDLLAAYPILSNDLSTSEPSNDLDNPANIVFD